ncbi:MAG: RimK/LysX family protein [Acidiferrobacterales bacterium]|nr:RimK/LysX family protein [Acidiferrobacterales bacterium]
MSKAFLFQVIVITFVSIAAPASAKEVVGWVENVKVYPGGIQIKSKIDTGAKTSSLNCQCITPIKRNGEDWVSFSIKNSDGDITMIEKPVLRVAKIRRFFGKSQERFVIKLGICLANVYHEEEVTLMDRSGFNYQMLIGRNFTRGDFLVDPGMTFITRPSCKQAPGK